MMSCPLMAIVQYETNQWEVYEIKCCMKQENRTRPGSNGQGLLSASTVFRPQSLMKTVIVCQWWNTYTEKQQGYQEIEYMCGCFGVSQNCTIFPMPYEHFPIMYVWGISPSFILCDFKNLHHYDLKSVHFVYTLLWVHHVRESLHQQPLRHPPFHGPIPDMLQRSERPQNVRSKKLGTTKDSWPLCEG